MTNFRKFFFGPGGQNENGNTSSGESENSKVSSAESSENIEEKDEKPIIEKIKDALQDWSNKDEADQEFDDTRV